MYEVLKIFQAAVLKIKALYPTHNLNPFQLCEKERISFMNGKYEHILRQGSER